MTDPSTLNTIPPMARLLGYAGLLPQAAAVAVLASGNLDWRFTALALAYAYAALIFTFLGGMWWGLAARAGSAPGWIYVAAVLPSLLALASAIPWSVGGAWPQPSLILLGMLILLSPLVDARISAARLTAAWWMKLRLPLSGGLGLLTLVAGLMRV